MYDSFFTVGLILAIIGGAFLIASIAMFFGFNIPALRKETSGKLEQKQIEEIRRSSSAAVGQRGKINVFEELEKNAKLKKTGSGTLNVAPNTAAREHRTDYTGTMVLNQTQITVNPDFIIEKNVMFVSTNEVI